MNEPSNQQRIVAIVGRPNVGKSALFNRLVGRRLAIVHEESGVTRDRLVCEANYEGQRFELMDTGGLAVMDGVHDGDAIQDATYRQADTAIEDAAVLVLVTDVTAGIAPLDEEVARRLRRSGKPVFIAANKADTAAVDDQAAEFERWGFPVFPLSALHARGVDRLMRAVLPRLPPLPAAEAETALRVAVVGRPNVGKSSFINRLLGSNRLIVSEVPGTTRDSVEIPFRVERGPDARRYVLIDTAGLRKKRSVRAAVEKFSVIRTERSIARADVVLLMMDAREGPTLTDKKIASFIGEKRRGCILVVNKWDLADGVVKEEGYETALRAELPFLDFVPIVFLSALDGRNMDRCVQMIDYVADQVSLSLGTGVLNRVLRDALHRNQPPMVKGRRLKLYYATQVGVHPVRLRLFVNDPSLLPSSYETYLVHALRKAFGLQGAPVVIHCSSSHDRNARE